MKILSIKNIFEFQDKQIDGVRENLLQNISNQTFRFVDQLQGLGTPDVCIITKQHSTNLMKSSFETQSSFHFVQGLCPQSQAEVFAYLQSILHNQEKIEHQSMFSRNSSITKLSYLSYDIFTKTILVCELQITMEGQHKSKTFAVQENQQYIFPTQQQWRGVYISSILRTIEEEFKLASVGRFFNTINLKSNSNLRDVIQLLLELIAYNPQQFQDLEKISSTQNFPQIKEVIHYLCWPLNILVQYLAKSHQMMVLIKELESIEDNVVFHMIKSALHYKMKNYEKSLSCLSNISCISTQIILIKYMFGKVFIKLGKYEQAYLILKDILINSYENQIIWTTLASIFRKQNNYQICLNLLNKAAGFQVQRIRKNFWREIHLQNYRVLTQNQAITQINDLDKVYVVINPICVDKIENFSQLSNHPVLEQLLLRPRNMDKKDIKIWSNYAQKFATHQAQKFENSVDFLQQNHLLENKQELTLVQKEIIKLSIALGHKKLQKYLQLYFYSAPHSSYNLVDNYVDKTKFEIKLKKQSLNCKENFFKKCQTTTTLCDIDSEEENEPEFLQQNLSQSVDLTYNVTKSKAQILIQNYQKNQSQSILQKQNSLTYKVIIQENAFESVESERDQKQIIHDKQFQRLQTKKTMETLSEQSFTKEHKVQIFGLIDHIKKIPLVQKTEMENIMKRQKDILNPILLEFVNYISQTQNIFDDLFYENQRVKTQQNTQQSSINCSEKQTLSKNLVQIFKSQLKESLQNKPYLEKNIEIQNFYTFRQFQLKNIEDNQLYFSLTKQESIFLYKCSKIAIRLKQFKLAQKLLEKINERVISVQISYFLLQLYKDDHNQMIQQIQKIMVDFMECGISQIESMPFWVEIHLIRLIKLQGSNYVLGLLSKIENYETFQLIKKIVLQTENLLQ